MLYERFCAPLREFAISVQSGVFGAKVHLSLVNDGPVTIILEA
jgi:D-tyrosyl-tRNA(Tyr) deacylase